MTFGQPTAGEINTPLVMLSLSKHGPPSWRLERPNSLLRGIRGGATQQVEGASAYPPRSIVADTSAIDHYT
jgi:hypothetical protein